MIYFLLSTNSLKSKHVLRWEAYPQKSSPNKITCGTPQMPSVQFVSLFSYPNGQVFCCQQNTSLDITLLVTIAHLLRA